MSIDIDFIENEWIPALRSGEYEQTDSYLHKGSGYCCLGVACDLLIKRGELDDWIIGGDSQSTAWVPEDVYAIGDEYQWLPAQVSARLGLEIQGDRADGRVFTGADGVARYPNLVAANDANVPFSMIADLIESYIEDVKRDSAP